MNAIKNIQFPKSGLLKNFGALVVVQSTNFLIPLITFPYLLRVVGTVHFGSITYSLSILAYLSIATDYGFNMTATRSVALCQNDKQKLSEIFTSVVYTKAFFYCLCLLVSLILCWILPRLQENSTLFLLGMLFVLGNAIMPTWFFQGIERMKYIAYVNVTAKLIQLGLIVLFVNTPDDYVWVLAMYGIGNIISGIYGFVVIRKQYKIHILRFRIQIIIEQIKEGWSIFISNLLTIFIMNGTVLIIGFYVSDKDLGYYSIADKIVVVMWSVLTLYIQVLYPRACKLATESHQKLIKFLFNSCLVATVAILIGCIVLFVYAEPVLHIISGYADKESVRLLRIMSFIPLASVLNILPSQFLLVHNLKKRYMTVIYIVAAVNLLITPFMVREQGVIGAAQAVIINQIIMTLAFYVACWMPYLNSARQEKLNEYTSSSLS